MTTYDSYLNLIDSIKWEPLQNAKHYTYCFLQYRNKLDTENLRVAFCKVHMLGRNGAKTPQFFTLEGKHIDYENHILYNVGGF